MATIEIWSFRDTAWSTENLTGFKVEAVDGGIGKVDEASGDVGGSYVVVDTGPWIFGKKIMLPAGVIRLVDADEETARAGGLRGHAATRSMSAPHCTSLRSSVS